MPTIRANSRRTEGTRRKLICWRRPSVEQMKQLSGNYSEAELLKAETGHEENRHALRHRVELNGREWDETVQKLAAMFGHRPVAAAVSPAKAATLTQIKTGVLSPLQEDETRFYATAVLEKTDQRFKTRYSFMA